MSIQQNAQAILDEMKGTNCCLVAVTKTKPVEALLEAYQCGLRDFGENKVQEMQEKQPALPPDVRWHLIGHLQTNKVKYIASFVHLIHSIDSLKLLQEVNKRAQQHGRTINCLLQIYIAQEDTKFGLSEEELWELLQGAELPTLQHISIRGLMGMASNTEDEVQIRKEFAGLKRLFEAVKQRIQLPQVQMEEISMGMSHDYRIAIEEGSTLIRVGSKIFGSR